MTGQTQSAAQVDADEQLKRSAGSAQGAPELGAPAPVQSPSRTTRPMTTQDEATAHMDAFRAKRDPKTPTLGPMFIKDRAGATQKKMDENRDKGMDIYAEETRKMIQRKDQEAYSQTGTTSSDRTAQGFSQAGAALHTNINEHGGALKAVDELAGGPVLQTAEAIGLAMHAQGTISARKDRSRQDAARLTKAAASEAHSGLGDSLDSMREHKTREGDYKPGQGGALLRGMGETVRAQNRARRAALAAGQDTIKQISVDHTLGESVPFAVADGTVIDETLGDQARVFKDARKKELADQKASLKQSAKERKQGGDADWDDRQKSNAEEKADIKQGLSEQDGARRERRKLTAMDARKGYQYALDADEAKEYKPARDAYEDASAGIEQKHDAHLKSLESDFKELNAQGDAQKEADRYRSNLKNSVGIREKEKFSKKDELDQHEADVKSLRDQQTKAITDKVGDLKSQLTGSDVVSDIEKLTATGAAQKEADRYRSNLKNSVGARQKEKFSKKDELDQHEADVKSLRDQQTKAITDKVGDLKTQLKSVTAPKKFYEFTDKPKSGSEAEYARLQEQISHHEGLAKQSTSNPLFSSPEFQSQAQLDSLNDSMKKARVLRREKETGLTEEQQRQHDDLQERLAKTPKSGSAEAQRLQDQISQHEEKAKKSASDPSYISSEHLSAAQQKSLHASMNKAGVLRREKDTGLTEEQQGQHDDLRARLDRAKSDSDAGADPNDIQTRDQHQGTVEKYRFVKKHGVTPEEHDSRLANDERLLAIKKESKTGLSAEEAERLDGIARERSEMKGMVKRSRAFGIEHKGEVVKDNRAGGLGTGFNEERAVTTDADARDAMINAGAKTAHSVGEVMSADLNKARKAMESNDFEHARNIALSATTQNVADIASSAVGGPAIGLTVKALGKGTEAVSDMVGGLTQEGADRAKFAEEARAMTRGPDGRTDRWHQVHDSVMDWHGGADVPFEGGVKKGAKQLLGMVRGEYGDDLKGLASDTVTGSSVVNSIADHTAATVRPLADFADKGAQVAHSAVNTVAPVAETVSAEANKLVDSAGGVANSVLGKAQETLGGAVGEESTLGVGAGLGGMVKSGSDAVSSKIDETANTARDAIAEHTTGLVDNAHAAIADNLEGLDEKAHDAVIAKAGSTAEDLVDTGFDKADAALTETTKKDEVIGKPLAPRPTADAPAPGPVVEPEPPGPTPEPTPGPTPNIDPEPVDKRRLHLAQIRAAGEKSTDAHADKRHDPTSPIAAVTKKEFKSWRQRIPRFARNTWQRAKNFGKRMWKGLSGFFGR